MIVKEKDWSTKSIKVSRNVHKRLTDLAHKNESYNSVIEKLLDFYKKNGGDNK
jgi:predicted CopG family antitoxin